MKHGCWSLALNTLTFLLADGSLLLSTIQMVRLIATKHAWWPADFLRHTALTTNRLFLLWFDLTPCAYYFLWQSIRVGLFINWTFQMLFCMVNLLSKCLWSNIQGMSIRGGLIRYVIFVVLFMLSNRVLGHGLTSSAILSLLLGSLHALWTQPCFENTHQLEAFL